ncbi:MAG TPA: MBOAT family protein [Gaiellaceae bacterium]|nr:MBOAT family protein [Gaiellaceae bacterium]
MLFPTVTFAVFFLIVLPVSWLLMPRPRLWRPFILLASYVFYAWWDWKFVFLLAASTLGNWLGGELIVRDAIRKRLWLALAVAFDLGLLGYFKYAGFLVSSVENGLTRLGLPAPTSLVGVVLPVGISFYTFMALSYVVDVYRGELETVPLPRFAVWLSFFPHLVAGPIVRGSELLPQLETPRDPREVDVTRAIFLIVSGLFLKVVIANHLATHVVDDVFASPQSHSSLEVLVAVYGYAVQIFADFCGYTNIAIGIALLLGFRFPQNFANPYTAVSLQDFWRRWHMTLSRWLRDYLYIPLGGNRKGKLLTYRNLLLTMLLGGLWHGAAWTFVAWGGIHGAGLTVERLWRDWRGPRASTAWTRWLGRLVTFHVVCLGWIFFRAASFGRAGDVIVRLFDAWGQASPLVTTGVVLAIVVGIAVQYVPLDSVGALGRGFARLPLAAQAAAVAVCVTVIDVLGPQGVAPFIYFRF